MLYKGDKDVNDAARPPEGSPAETRDLLASSLPWSIDVQSTQSAGTVEYADSISVEG